MSDRTRDEHHQPQQPAARDATAGANSLPLDLQAVEAFAHRVRSCVSTIRAAADYLLGGSCDVHRHQGLLRVISEAATSIDRLLSDLMVLAQGNGVDCDQLGPVDLVTVARRAVRDLALLCQVVGAWPTVHVPVPCPPVLGDEELLHQAVLGALRSVAALARPGDRVVASLQYVPGDAPGRSRVELSILLDSPLMGAGPPVGALQAGDLSVAVVQLIAARHGGSIALRADPPGLRLSLPAARHDHEPMAQAAAQKPLRPGRPASALAPRPSVRLRVSGYHV